MSGSHAKQRLHANRVLAPAVPGVTVYISDFKRSIADKLKKDFFSEPSQVRGTVTR